MVHYNKYLLGGVGFAQTDDDRQHHRPVPDRLDVLYALRRHSRFSDRRITMRGRAVRYSAPRRTGEQF